MHGLQIPGVTPDQSIKMKPDWSIVLAFEQKLRREAMKLVTQEGHTLADAMRAVIRDADLLRSLFHDTSCIEGCTVNGATLQVA